MAMPVVVPRYTVSDLESFPDDGNRYELLDGVLLVTSGPIPLHQLVTSRLVAALSAYLAPTGLAHVYSPGTVEIEPNLHLEPDVLVVPVDERQPGPTLETRWSEIRRWWLGVEVSGPGSRIYDRDHKGPAYLAVGVREVWRVDLRDRCVYVTGSGSLPEVRHVERVVWHPPELDQPLVIPVPALFEAGPPR